MRRAYVVEPGRLDITADPVAIVGSLLDWMSTSRRELPWRRHRTPYSVWISEIMLQQTQVDTVVPYFERWLLRFPDLPSLAAAPLDDVLKAWEGLGYYARARNIHRAAQLMMAQHGGRVPENAAALLRLPGIGRYTVGAILSIAYGQAAPILDGNVRRVLCRVYDITGDPREPSTESQLWDLSTDLVKAAPAGKAGEFNEALMELGALVCTPTNPACPLCPLKGTCLALARGTIDLRPARSPAAATPYRDVVAAIVHDHAGNVLVIRRKMAGLLGGLWGFPGGTAQPGEELHAAIVRTVREQVGIDIEPGAELGRVKHAYTHFRITLHGYYAEWLRGEPVALGCADVRWAALAELESYAFAVTDRKIARRLSAR